jgi:hypothetical protein
VIKLLLGIIIWCLDSSLKRDSCFDGREFLGHGFGGCVPSQGLAGTVVH